LRRDRRIIGTHFNLADMLTMRLRQSPLLSLWRCLPCIVLLASPLLGGCRATLFAGLNSTDQHRGIEQRRDIVFDAARHLALDVYMPQSVGHTTDSGAPIVVFFYGGDWTHGKRQWYRFVGTSLAAKGIVVVIPDYRKYPQVKMDGFMRDGARAVAWAHAHAGEFGGDPKRVFVMGHSAGGQIAALLSTDPAWLAPYGLRPNELAGFIGLAGVYDFMPIPAREKDMLGTFGRTPAEQARAQPVRFVSGHEPPMLLLQGTGDHEVDPSNALSLDKAMLAAHEDVTLKLYPRIGHSPLLFAMSRPLRDHAPTLADIVDFIRQHDGVSHAHH
jgi:acetyl esterase/lipase